MTVRSWFATVVAALALTACIGSPDQAHSADSAMGSTTVTVTATESLTSTTTAPGSTSPSSTSNRPTSPLPTTPRPDWLGRRTIPTTIDGLGLVVETPPELIDRRLATIDTLPPPTNDNVFDPRVRPLDEVPEVLARSTWQEGCPVQPEDLAYIVMPFWGFDGWQHNGELIVHRTVADDVVSVFEQLWATRFPIEEMRIVTPADLDAPPIGDGNNSGSFVCRPITGGTAFSEHAKGLAIDINPFHNPYVRDDRVLPEQASAYTDRAQDLPGMISPDSVVVQAFTDIGWTWGGNWNSLKDYQHFSASGR